MNRKEKLKKLLGTRQPSPPGPSGDDPGPARSEQRRHQPPPRILHLESDAVYGRIPLGPATPVEANLLRLANIPPQAHPFRRIIFFDTETTGLSHGTGTHIFLLGLAELVIGRSELIIHQHFMEDPGTETEFLECIRNDFHDADLLVCFNGKSYDLPLLQTRLRMNDLPVLTNEIPVLDLLYPARRLWRERLGHCDLQNLEREILGHWRQGDLPGALIPDRYFRYLHHRDPAEVEIVFEHNRQDILAMVALQAHLNQLLDLDTPTDVHSLHCLARTMIQRGHDDAFNALLDTHGEHIHTAAYRHAGMGRSLAYLHKRAGNRAEAYRLFLHLSEHRPHEVPDALEEVLIYEEHHSRNLPLALEHCDHFLSLAAHWPGQEPLRQRLRHRRQRLERKLARLETTDGAGSPENSTKKSG